jgi:hypothetical protein
MSMAILRALVFVPLVLLAGCAVEAPLPQPEPPAAKLIAAGEGEPLSGKTDGKLLDATSASDKIVGTLLQYATVRGLAVEPLRRTLVGFTRELAQLIRREVISKVWIDVPGPDGLACERYEVKLVYQRGLTTYHVNERALDVIADLPKAPPNLRNTEVWYLSREPGKTWRPARELHPLAREVKLGRVFDAGRVAGDATAWVSVELVQN